MKRFRDDNQREDAPWQEGESLSSGRAPVKAAAKILLSIQSLANAVSPGPAKGRAAEERPRSMAAADFGLVKSVRKSLLVVVSLGLVGLLGLGAALWWNRNDPRLRWREEIVAFKLLGALPSESWARVSQRVTPLFLHRPDIFGGMNLQASEAVDGSAEEGAQLFAEHCVACHGDRDAGLHSGADLTSPDLQVRMSDLDIYLAMTRGVTGTNMPATEVSVAEGLRLTAYVRSLRSGDGGQAEAAAPQVECPPCQRINVSFDSIATGANHPEGWMSYHGDYSGQRFSKLRQIDRTNVSLLRPRFIYQMKSLVGLQSTPLVADGVMFVTGPENEVVALDLETGRPFWTFRRTVPSGVSLPGGRPNRGVALLGDRVFHNTLDAHLIALDVKTGKPVWDVEVADFHEGYSMTGAPLAVENAIIVGVGGGDFGARGFVDAYDPDSGKRLWRFETVPGPGQAGHETWENDAWKTGGGATWVTGTYDKELGLIYWGVGNPAPDYNPAARPGDNLYTCSVIALNAKDGTLRWHYQFSPNDGNDWDASQVPVLVDAAYQGQPRKLMLFANRNCFYYVLDRETGKFLQAKSFCKQNWNDGFTAEGRPIRRPGSTSSASGPLVSPGVTGGSNWLSPGYSPLTGLMYVKNYHQPARVFAADANYLPGKIFLGGHTQEAAKGETRLTALQGLSGEVVWEKQLELGGTIDKSGVLTTITGLVFTGDGEGGLCVLDATDGSEVWRYELGGEMAMAPITYLFEGHQEVAVISGGSLSVLSEVDSQEMPQLTQEQNFHGGAGRPERASAE